MREIQRGEGEELAYMLLCVCVYCFVVSDSLQPHRLQPTRPLCPWDSPGKNTGVGCHFLLKRNCRKKESEVTQLCPILYDPMDCSLPGSSICGIFQARVLEWVGTGAGKTEIYRAGWQSGDSDKQCTIAPISHASKVMLKILHIRSLMCKCQGQS